MRRRLPPSHARVHRRVVRKAALAGSRSELSAKGNVSVRCACGRMRRRHSMEIHRWRSIRRGKRETTERESGASTEASEPREEKHRSTCVQFFAPARWRREVSDGDIGAHRADDDPGDRHDGSHRPDRAVPFANLQYLRGGELDLFRATVVAPAGDQRIGSLF